MRYLSMVRRRFTVAGGVCLLLMLLVPAVTFAQEQPIKKLPNRLMQIGLEKSDDTVKVTIDTERPVGFRYTVYDSTAPVRVVMDFPGMELAEIPRLLSGDGIAIEEVRVSSFELSSGKLARVEIVLRESIPYKVALNDRRFELSFTRSTPLANPSSETVPPTVPVGVAEPLATTVQSPADPVAIPPSEVPPPPAGGPVSASASETVLSDNSSAGSVVSPAVAQPTAPLVAELSNGTPVAATSVAGASADATIAIAATRLEGLTVEDEALFLKVNGKVARLDKFKLKNPSRLVVDLYGIKSGLKETRYKLGKGMGTARLGTHPDKVRVVIEVNDKLLTRAYVVDEGRGVRVDWSGTLSADSADVNKGVVAPLATMAPRAVVAVADVPKVAEPKSDLKSEVVSEQTSEVVVTPGTAAAVADPPQSETQPLAQPLLDEDDKADKPVSAPRGLGPVMVEKLEFKIEGEKSLIVATLSGPAEILSPVRDGTLIRFGVKHAAISRSLRRTIDASAFPSAVSQVTPYTVREKGRQDVRFAVQLKGKSKYSISHQGKELILFVDNGKYAEPAPATGEKIALNPPAMREAQPETKPAEAAPPAEPAAKPAATPSPSPVEVAASDATPATPADEHVQPDTAVAGATKEVGKKQSVKDKDSEKKYSGQKISLVFDNADIRNILQLIGEVSSLNIIAGEDVSGTITLRLIDVPWDQALDLIMDTKGLGMLREGNVVRIMPKDKLRAMRQDEMKAEREEQQLEPMITEYISVSYTSLANVSGPVKERLSSRGKINEDARNKKLIVTDVPAIIQEVKKLVTELDTPEKQVMIEARIVEARSTFSRDLGVKWGASFSNPSGGPGAVSSANVGVGGGFLITPPVAGSVMGGAGFGSGITFGRIGTDSTILDLRISALEASGLGRVVSTPRITTLNGGQATISQGTKIPYQSTGSEGVKTEFVDANLQLTVTPVINPDDSIILDISASNSSIGSNVSTGAGSAPAIDTKDAKTKVLVRNGETTVIGGVFVETEIVSEAGVPLLSKIPILGNLFKSKSKSKERAELLIFITPRILD